MSADGPFIFGPPTIWIAPAGTEAPAVGEDIYDPDGPWELLHPSVPDFPPDA